MTGIFKAYDVRGSYPDELDETMARKIGAAFVSLLGARGIVVGRDMRLSARTLAKAFVEGATSSGASVADIGKTTTPMLYYAIIEGKFDGGAMVTASHLPGGMNGLKLCREAAIPLSGDHGLPTLERLVREELPPDQGQTSKASYQERGVLDKYIDRLDNFVHNPGPLKVAVDAGNGMAGPEVSALFARFPIWRLLPMYMEPDGTFPNHIANPLLPSTTRDLQARVAKDGADMGVAFDGDADCCGFVDEEGERIPQDLVTALIAEFLLTKEPGATILYDLRSSRIVPETITHLGGEAVRTRVGHAFIKEGMREADALFAGELSGHYYYRDMGFTDNGILTMVHMLNFLSSKNAPLSDLIRPLKKCHSTGEINIRANDRNSVFSALESRYGDARRDHLDGVTVEYDTWWFNLRASNTEPVMRLNLEANDKGAMRARKEEVLRIIEDADPSLTIEQEPGAGEGQPRVLGPE